MDNLKELDISTEEWREYELINRNGKKHSIWIDKPVKLFINPGGSTHRVVNETGQSFCCPAPEVYGCFLRWKTKDSDKPVNF